MGISLKRIESKPLTPRRKLPSPGVVGIYFLYEAATSTVVYIGSSRNVLGRLRAGHGDKDWDSYRIVECAPEMLVKLERNMIRRFKPIYNLDGVVPRQPAGVKVCTTVPTKMQREIARAAKEECCKTPADWLYKRIVFGLQAAELRRAKERKAGAPSIPPELDHPV